MILKTADDKTADIETLEALRKSPSASASQKAAILREIKFMRAGISGEEQCAYEIEFELGASKNWAILHDLRIEARGFSAQIDHLLINRYFEFVVIESKSFSEGLAINERQECTAFFRGSAYGVPSPIEQNRKHIEVLKNYLADNSDILPRRLGMNLAPSFKSLVLISNKARLSLPKKSAPEYKQILKAEQFQKWFDSYKNSLSPFQVSKMAKIIAQQTVQDFGKALASRHVPIRFDWAGKFGLPPLEMAAPAPTPTPEEVKEAPKIKWSNQSCERCNSPLTFAEFRFCRMARLRFKDALLCRSCQ